MAYRQRERKRFQEEIKRLASPEFRAFKKNAPMSSRKARLVADLIRNKNVNSALSILEFSDKRAAVFIGKVLGSAIASARASGAVVNERELYVKAIQVGQGEHKNMKRWRPRAMGRAAPYWRYRCHIEVIVAEKREESAEG
jgi:large subunit ribosomal protein L22